MEAEAESHGPQTARRQELQQSSPDGDLQQPDAQSKLRVCRWSALTRPTKELEVHVGLILRVAKRKAPTLGVHKLCMAHEGRHVARRRTLGSVTVAQGIANRSIRGC